MENKIKSTNYLYGLEENDYFIKNNFCGTKIKKIEHVKNDENTLLYIYGNILDLVESLNNLKCKILIIKELSYNYENLNIEIITIGEVPLNINDVGIYFKSFFNNGKDYFSSIINEHQFQSLTESNKQTNAFRKGIYITKVENLENDELKFKLLRCSSNLSGSTDNFKESDNEICNKVNNISKYFFEEHVELNHVLAQVYDNNKDTCKKAKIREHSDKTKDMPRNGVMGFCSFYNQEELNKAKVSQKDNYDYVYKETSVLTRLKFRLKECVKLDLVKQFDVILYPNSLFLMPLSTNRLYTHEICPSVLNPENIPTRMGYVIRCSKTNAIFKDNKTFIINDNKELIELVEPCEEEIKKLKDLYYEENTLDTLIDYGIFNFSLNIGDYKKPTI